jgi:TolB-like protein/Tfp pilus assembly protein PilF
VFRVAIAYLAAAWLLTEVSNTLFEIFEVGETASQMVVILLAIGFPLFLVFSWVFELTPEGLKLEKDIDRSVPVTRKTGKQLDRVIIVLLALALGYFAFDKFVLEPARVADIVEETAQQARSEALVESYGDQSIAVLPFVNMSSDPEQEYFSDGMAEELLNLLARVPELRVISRSSSFSFKGQNIDLPSIAAQLNVVHILEGSVRKAGNRIRVTAQLIEARSDTHLWSETYDRELNDIFAIQDEIAGEVVEALKVTLPEGEKDRLAQRYQPTLEAYEQLIRGRHEMDKRTATSLAAAEQHFKQAIELDPDYALAYVNLASTYHLQSNYGGLAWEESVRRQQPLIDRALQLDPLSGEAYFALAMLLSVQAALTGEDHSSANEEAFQKAMELSPNTAEALSRYGDRILWREGRIEEAVEYARKAVERDPMSPILHLRVAVWTWQAGRAKEAFALLRRNIERNPEFPNNYGFMGGYLSRLGHVGEAQKWYEEGRKRNPVAGTSVSECIGFLNLGDRLSVEQCVEQYAEALPGESQVLWWLLYLYKGELELAITTLESAVKRAPGVPRGGLLLANLTAGQGNVERARQLMADAFPKLLEDELSLLDRDVQAAVVFAAILHTIGEVEQRDVLLASAEERIASMHRIHGIGYGIADVYIHAMRGDRDRAIAALREAVDRGWGAYINLYYFHDAWWTLRHDWKLKPLHDDPEFITITDELEAKFAAQRQWYEENRDKPLF